MIGVVGEMPLEPRAGEATTAAAGFFGAIELVVVGARALDTLGAVAAAVLPPDGSATWTDADGAGSDEPGADVPELLLPAEEALEATVADPPAELADVQATAPASRPTVMPIRAVRRPQVLRCVVILIACPYG